MPLVLVWRKLILVCTGPLAAISMGVCSLSCYETGSAALTYSWFWGGEEQVRELGPGFRVRLGRNVKKTKVGTCKKHQQHLTQSCEARSSAGFSPS